MVSSHWTKPQKQFTVEFYEQSPPSKHLALNQIKTYLRYILHNNLVTRDSIYRQLVCITYFFKVSYLGISVINVASWNIGNSPSCSLNRWIRLKWFGRIFFKFSKTFTIFQLLNRKTFIKTPTKKSLNFEIEYCI